MDGPYIDLGDFFLQCLDNLLLGSEDQLRMLDVLFLPDFHHSRPRSRDCCAGSGSSHGGGSIETTLPSHADEELVVSEFSIFEQTD